MKHVLRGTMVVAAGLAMLWAGMALARPTDADKCEADKMKRAGKYAFCRMKAEANAVKKGEAPDYTKCDEKLAEKFGKAETKWGAECPTLGDVGEIQDQVTADSDCLAVKLGGERFVDNGDGIITDCQTGLMWEKKDDNNAGGIHDLNLNFSWSSTPPLYELPDGTAFTVFLNTLNNKCDDDEATACTTDADCALAPDTYASNGLCGHAGYRDWRLPHVDDDLLPLPAELDGLIDGSEPAPKIFTAFKSPCTPGCTVETCSCTQSYYYWSSTTASLYPNLAYYVHFADGDVDGDAKDDYLRVRAVRGGL